MPSAIGSSNCVREKHRRAPRKFGGSSSTFSRRFDNSKLNRNDCAFAALPFVDRMLAKAKTRIAQAATLKWRIFYGLRGTSLAPNRVDTGTATVGAARRRRLQSAPRAPVSPRSDRAAWHG